MPEWVSPYRPHGQLQSAASIKTEPSFSTLLPHPTHPDLLAPADSHILSRGEVQKLKHRQYMVEYRKSKKRGLVEVQQLLSDDDDDEEGKKWCS